MKDRLLLNTNVERMIDRWFRFPYLERDSFHCPCRWTRTWLGVYTKERKFYFLLIFQTILPNEIILLPEIRFYEFFFASIFSFFSPTFASSRRRKLRRYYQDDISRNVRCLNDSNEAARGNRKHCFATRQE